jgi:hypothetical protein
MKGVKILPEEDQVKMVGTLSKPEEESQVKKGWNPSKRRIPGKNCWASSRRGLEPYQKKTRLKWLEFFQKKNSR